MSEVRHSAVAGLSPEAGVKGFVHFAASGVATIFVVWLQVVLRVAADEFLVGGKGNVAFQDPGALPGGSEVRFQPCVRELQRRAAMPDREQSRLTGLPCKPEASGFSGPSFILSIR